MTTSGWVLLGAPWDCSGTGRGEQLAPAALRAAGLASRVAEDAGDADVAITSAERDAATGVSALDETVRAAHALTAALDAVLSRDNAARPLVVGGDCSILLGIVPALLRQVGPVGLWFVDGHPDCVDGHLSETGETADMDLAVLIGDGAEPLVTLAGQPPMIPADRAVLLGHRTTGLDAASAAELDRVPAALRRIDAAAVTADPRSAGRTAAEWLATAGRGSWLHVDLDVLDPSALQAVTYPQTGGLDWDSLAALMMPLTRSPRLLGVSIADFRPDLDPAGDGARRIVDLLRQTLTDCRDDRRN